jgi:hypothetical protein
MQAAMNKAHTEDALVHGVMLPILCVISYWLTTHMLAHIVSVSRDDDLLGGMWDEGFSREEANSHLQQQQGLPYAGRTYQGKSLFFTEYAPR